jgi:multiple sugar transport system permease protein
VALLGAAYWVWQKAVKDTSDRKFALFSLLAIQLALGGSLMVSQLPTALTAADDDLMQGFWVTALYVAGTVPVQLSLALGLAALLFRAARGKAIFRIVYFLPYITPFAATAVVFSVLFSNRDQSPINRLLGLVGIEPQTWLLEAKPINELIFGVELPRIIEGPGLALLVIIMWSTWTYVGFDIVVFLAGLGNISPEFYEAAQIDGASQWKAFRHITLPLLSPTTFFLSLIAIIGTFQAFTQIWIMRRPATYDTVDTVGVYLYEVISDANPRYGFGSAMAFVLFGLILVVNLLQNRVMGRKVFYG